MRNWLEAIRILINLDLTKISRNKLILIRDNLYKFVQTIDKEISKRDF